MSLLLSFLLFLLTSPPDKYPAAIPHTPVIIATTIMQSHQVMEIIQILQTAILQKVEKKIHKVQMWKLQNLKQHQMKILVVK